MNLIKEIMETLEAIPQWKRLKDLPEIISSLEERIKALESKFDKAPGNVCEYCGAYAVRLIKHVRDRKDFKCGDCGKEYSKTSSEYL